MEKKLDISIFDENDKLKRKYKKEIKEKNSKEEGDEKNNKKLTNFAGDL